MTLTIECVNSATQGEAVRLLALQFDEHHIALPALRLEGAVAGLIGPAGFGAMLLAREAGQAVGLAALSYLWTLEHGGLAAWLDELYVVPERRGHGVGRALLERAAAVALEAGCSTIDLEVDREHARVEALYERMDFSRLPRSRWVRRFDPGKGHRSGPHRPVPSLDHLSLGVNDLARSKAFYDAALAPLGLVAHPQASGDIGYGPPGPEPVVGFAFYIGFEERAEVRPVAPSAGFHVALSAGSREKVRSFHRAALAAGGQDRGAPALRPRYHADYYGAFVVDPDGHHIEAVCHVPEAT